MSNSKVNHLFFSQIINIKKQFFNTELKLLTFFYDITNEAYLLDPKLLIKYWDNFRISLGAEFFGGPEYTILGMFKDNDQVYVLVEVDF